jgi:protein-tyrosine-phosphatase
MAEAYFRSLKTGIETLSSGARADEVRDRVYPAVVEHTTAFLHRHDIDTSALSPQPVQLTQDRLRDDDVTVVMDDALDNAKAIVQLPANIRVWDVSDVEDEATRDSHIEQVYAQIRQRVDELVGQLDRK